MPDAVPYGPPLADHEDVYRAILYPMHWNAAAQCPSSAAFDTEVFSVDVASRATPVETRTRFKQVIELVRFNVGLARAIGFDSRDEADALFPENKAHAHVYFVGYSELSRGNRKTAARKLCDLCSLLGR